MHSQHRRNRIVCGGVLVVQHDIETIVCIHIFILVLKSRLSYN